MVTIDGYEDVPHNDEQALMRAGRETARQHRHLSGGTVTSSCTSVASSMARAAPSSTMGSSSSATAQSTARTSGSSRTRGDLPGEWTMVSSDSRETLRTLVDSAESPCSPRTP